jgi:hypothetical protein
MVSTSILGLSSIVTANVIIDPKYEEEVSGCTASVAVISKAHIWVVSLLTTLVTILCSCAHLSLSTKFFSRQTQVIQDQSLASKVVQSHYRLIINPRMKVRNR